MTRQPQPAAPEPASVDLVRAAVWRGGADVEIADAPAPELAPGDALVRIDLATVCGSDRHTATGRRPGPCPSVLGHEGVGRVVAVDAHRPPARTDGRTLEVGDRIVWGVAVSCGACDRCRGGLTAKCREVRKVGHEAWDSPWPLSGTYASHILLPSGTPVAGVPDAVPDAVASPAGCATATVAAAMERAGALTGRRVLVTGAGMLGLVAVAMAAEAGAAEVTAIDLDPARREEALRFGATSAADAVPPRSGLDVAIDLTGAPAVIGAAFESLDIGGRLVLVGSVTPAPPVPFDAERMVRRWLTVAGVHNYEPRHLQRAVDFLATTADRLPWAGLVSAPRGLEALSGMLMDERPSHPRLALAP
ncbi:zinc-binding dehydrogenase [Demequina pelophila]|uniref:zinc-binding dehydrogenase n=1 Tax=Demequina pelophila TaxID=1638984 RepID=UPI000781FB3E|nr:zinc-binding dehydrogenase [Demequina pelophila]